MSLSDDLQYHDPDSKDLSERGFKRMNDPRVCTNNDIKRLKEMLVDMKLWPPNPLKIEALIARLEAAEKVCQYLSPEKPSKHLWLELQRRIEAWRKAAGK